MTGVGAPPERMTRVACFMQHPDGGALRPTTRVLPLTAFQLALPVMGQQMLWQMQMADAGLWIQHPAGASGSDS